MDFKEFSTWIEENGFTFELEAWGGCAVDLITICKNGKEVSSAGYCQNINYDEIVETLINLK
ncbi:hypothetical protein [Clostridium sp.]|uniref:hypothetical protein n=1 Tax=Clostridium sp. TaxID=1506 RepID=UPI001A595909|nr:hypothetical protein [Clostridium sp.]MBK5234830.1 hypothetical protein [Clostridium sp.]